MLKRKNLYTRFSDLDAGDSEPTNGTSLAKSALTKRLSLNNFEVPMVQKSLFSSASVEWSTPSWLFEALNAEFNFTLDPCCTKENAKCKKFFTKEDDGLAKDWGTNTVFMNPPYGKTIGSWMEKAFQSSRHGATVVALVPARTDTRWWQNYAMKGEIRLLKRRVKFGGGEFPAPFPSSLVIFRPPWCTIRSFDKPKSELLLGVSG